MTAQRPHWLAGVVGLAESVGIEVRPCCRGNFSRFGRNGAAETVRVDPRRGIIFFAATKVRILPARHVEQPRRQACSGFCPTMPSRNPCRSCTLVTPQLAREPSLLRPFRPNPLKFPGNTGGLRSQRIPQFESDHPSHAVGLSANRPGVPGRPRPPHRTTAPSPSFAQFEREEEPLWRMLGSACDTGSPKP
jgi:hypothetical protein